MIKHALMGFAISLGCFLPPLIHFVTAPIGPLIGGWFAGSKHRAEPEQALVIGALMGLFMVLPVGAVLALDKLVPSLNSWVDSDILTIIGIMVLVYTTVLGSVGAMVGGYMASRDEASHDVPVSE
ncbi:MAG: DUF5518 domain-containing protein [Chloroflexi bacterium]|nr:DUF5518 domain-containing protein [Chloroflexota bacterium]